MTALPAARPPMPTSPPERLTTVISRRPAEAPSVRASTPTRSLLRASYAELYRLAEAMLRQGRRCRAIDPRTLVNEAARHSLGASGLQDLTDRAAYFAFLANALRRVLADLVHEHRRDSREPAEVWLSVPGVAGSISLVTLLAELTRLQDRSEHHSQIAVLRMLGGLSDEEIADEMCTTPARAAAGWKSVCEWLNQTN